MVKMPIMTKAEQFRAKGSNILKDRSFGMSDFLNDLPPQSENTQIHKPTITQIHTTKVLQEQTKTGGQSPNVRNEALGRLHLQIRQDLIDKLLDTVFKRKRDSKFKGREATQRSVIEDALEQYFRRHGNQIECDKPEEGNMESG